jgi:hypothetical protein
MTLSQTSSLGSRCGLAGKFLVEAGHDLEQGRFTGAVHADDADLGVGVEAQPDILEHLLAARIGLGQALHLENVLLGHGRALSGWEVDGTGDGRPRDVARRSAER